MSVEFGVCFACVVGITIIYLYPISLCLEFTEQSWEGLVCYAARLGRVTRSDNYLRKVRFGLHLGSWCLGWNM
jgi:hypothetical protein